MILNMKQKLRLSFFLTVFMVVASFAQVTTSKIQGIVNDENNEGLFGANVIATHEPTGTVSGTMTLDGGRFNLPNLRIGGPYTISISFVGYQTMEYTDVYLDLGSAFDLNVDMVTDSNQLEEVVITSSKSTTFNNSRTGAETSVGQRELTKLPTISRSAADFTRLDPTASGGSFGGANDQFNNFTLDGSIFNNPFGLDAATPGGQTDAQPVSLDAIEQISVSRAPYDVSLSGFTGASVNAVTKSGTNKISGTVYGYYRNQDLTGSKVKGDDIFVPKLNQTQYGVSVGGPIIKNKLFFFANFEKDERTDLGQTWAPNTGTGAINESRVLESDLLSVQNILSQVNIGGGEFYNPGLFEGYTHDSNSTKGLFKLDWNLNDKHRLALIYNFLDASKDKNAHPTALGFRGPNSQILQFENAGYQINNKINSFLAELNSTFADNVTNKFQIGWTHFEDFRNPKSSPAPTITLLDENGASNYIIAGHEPFSIHNTLDQKVFQFSNNLNISTGDHNLTFGISFEKFQFDNSFNLGVYGAQGVFFPTGTINDFRNLDAAGEAALVATYQGYFDGAIAANTSLEASGVGNSGGWALAETNVGQMAFYMQDEWNVTDNLKVTAGLRFDKPLFFDSAKKAQEVIDRSCCYIPSIPYTDPSNGETVFFDSTKMPDSDVIISPRVGFNWDITGDKTNQLRGGTGIFTGRFPFVWLGNQIGNPNFFFYQVVDPDFKFPTVWRSSLGFDKKLESGLTLTADLSYTKDINGAHVQNWGLKAPTGTLNGVGDTRERYLPADVGNAAYVFTNSDKGWTFNGTVSAKQTFSNGIYASLAYNYLNSQSVNSIEAEITGDAFAFNPVVGNANDAVLSHSKYGDTHRFIGVVGKTWSYGAKDQWSSTLSGVLEFAQGGRFNYTYAGDINGDGSGLNDLIYIPTSSEVSQMVFAGLGQAEAFEAFIQQDDYMSDHRGEYFERYGALAPWRGKIDMKFIQEFTLGNDNAIQFSADILNLGNLISSDWGLIQQPDAVQPIGVTVDGAGNPTYSFDGNITETYVYDISLASRWQVQFGLRYIF